MIYYTYSLVIDIQCTRCTSGYASIWCIYSHESDILKRKYMIKCEKKYSLLYIKKHKECNASTTLRYTKMPYPPKITNEKKSDHNFLYPSDRKHKNVPEKIANL